LGRERGKDAEGTEGKKQNTKFSNCQPTCCSKDSKRKKTKKKKRKKSSDVEENRLLWFYALLAS